jgi:hypothetical protein
LAQLVNNIRRFVPAVVLAVALLMIYLFLNPSEEKRIRVMLASLAKDASVSAESAPLGNLGAAHKLQRFFTQDVEVNVDIPAAGHQSIKGREGLLQAILLVRANPKGLTVNFEDINLKLAENKETAEVELTAKVETPGEKEIVIQELTFELVKKDNKWQT